jgi:hypothetical protein
VVLHNFLSSFVRRAHYKILIIVDHTVLHSTASSDYNRAEEMLSMSCDTKTEIHLGFIQHIIYSYCTARLKTFSQQWILPRVMNQDER